MGEPIVMVGWRRREISRYRSLYTENGRRYNYGGLSDRGKRRVQSEMKSVSSEMYKRLKSRSVLLKTDTGRITVQFTHKNISHFVRDAMMTLGGRYLNRHDMVHIDGILSKAKYVKTSNLDIKGRRDGKQLFFRYKDRTGRGVYFKVAYEPNNGERKYYTLYSVSNR